MERLIGVFGVIVIMGLAFLFCPAGQRKNVNWRTVGLGMLLLAGFAVLVLHTPVKYVFSLANGFVDKLLSFSSAGSTFIFNALGVNAPPVGFVFATQILPTIIFFAAFMAVMYHLGVMPFIIRNMARFISKFLGVSGAESFSTVSDIFVGQTEAPLVIRPYIATLTQSELMACMIAGFATTAGGVLVAYVGMLRDHIPDIAGHLIACSVMCAPASLVIAKLMLPESEEPQTLGDTKIEIPRVDANVIDAAARGTTDGLRLAVNVAAMLISFVALTAMINYGLGKIGISLEQIFGWIFWPLSWVMGVPAEDVSKVATLLGKKVVLTELIAYQDMSEMLKQTNGEWLTPRGRLIASYALCGFANFASIGIQIGGYSGLCPERRGDLSRLGFRAMIGGTLATCMVAAIAGVLLGD